MGGTKIAGIVLLVVGIGFLLLSLLAYPIGIGGPSFGPRQIAGVIVGAVVAVVGLVLTLRK